MQGFPFCDKNSTKTPEKNSISVIKQLDFDEANTTADGKDIRRANDLKNVSYVQDATDKEKVKDVKDSASQTETGLIFHPRGNFLRCCILLGLFLCFLFTFGTIEVDDKVRYSALRPRFFEDSFVIFSYKKVRPSYL